MAYLRGNNDKQAEGYLRQVAVQGEEGAYLPLANIIGKLRLDYFLQLDDDAKKISKPMEKRL